MAFDGNRLHLTKKTINFFQFFQTHSNVKMAINNAATIHKLEQYFTNGFKNVPAILIDFVLPYLYLEINIQ